MTTTTPKPRSKRALAITGAVAFVLGIIFGAASSGGGDSPPADASPPKPAPTVTVTAEPEVVEVATTTPQACITALKRADKILAINVEVHELVADFLGNTFPAAIEAAASWDAAGIESATDDLKLFTAKVEDATDRVGQIDYLGAAEECRAGGER